MITQQLSVKWILIWIIGTIGLMGLFYLGVERGGDIATMVMVLLLVVLSPSFYLSGVFLHEGNRQASILRLRKTVSREHIQAMSAKRIMVGMTEQMVRLAWEKPKWIEASADGGAGMVYEQASYSGRCVRAALGRFCVLTLKIVIAQIGTDEQANYRYRMLVDGHVAGHNQSRPWWALVRRRASAHFYYSGARLTRREWNLLRLLQSGSVEHAAST